MQEIECEGCGWKGKWKDLDTENRGHDDIGICPECGSDDITDIDSVGPDDYRSQNPREMPRE